MSSNSPTPASTLVILLGASHFPELGIDSHSAAEVESTRRAFQETAREVERYFKSTSGYNLPETNLFSLFDSEKGPDEQDRAIHSFLNERITAGDNGAASSPTDLILYYIGHGTPDEARMYCLAIRNTRSANIGISSLRVVDIATTLSIRAAQLRVYLILDACYAANATKAFTMATSPVTSLKMQLDESDNLPPRGVSMLCSSSSISTSLIKASKQRTMFSESVLEVLWSGNGDESLDKLSLERLHQETLKAIQHKNPGTAVRPEIHSPQQTVGDIRSIPLFPNNVGLVREKREQERQEAIRKEAERQLKLEHDNRLETERKQLADEKLRTEREARRILEDEEAKGVHERQLDRELIIGWLKRAVLQKELGLCEMHKSPRVLAQVIGRMDAEANSSRSISFETAAIEHCRQCRLAKELAARREQRATRFRLTSLAILKGALLILLEIYFFNYLAFALSLAHKDFDLSGPPIASPLFLRIHVVYVASTAGLFGLLTTIGSPWAFFNFSKETRPDENAEPVIFVFCLIGFVFGLMLTCGAGFFLWSWGWQAAIAGKIFKQPTQLEGFIFAAPTLLAVYLFLSVPYSLYSQFRDVYVSFRTPVLKAR